MKTNVAIEQFAQKLYKEFETGTISYGYNSVSETYIVRVENDSLMKDESFLMKVFEFTHNQAKVGEWIMFVSPTDPICFDDYRPIAREYANSNTFVDVSSWFSKMLNSGSNWSKVSFGQLSCESSLENFPQEELEYALAA